MKLNLPTLTAEQQAIALTPEIGAESSKVMFTTEPCHQLGGIEVTQGDVHHGTLPPARRH